MQLTDPVSVLPKTHSTTVKRLHTIGIHTIGDLVQYFPKRYVDYSHTSSIALVQEGETVTLAGVIQKATNRYIRRNFTLQEVVIKDSTGEIKLVWFNQPYIVRMAAAGLTLAAAGDIEKQGKHLILKPQEYEIMQEGTDQHTHTGKIVPIYSQKGGLSTRLLREKISFAMGQTKIHEIPEWLPAEIVDAHHLMPYSDALQIAHIPQSLQEAQRARSRFAFDELFTLHLANNLIRKEWHAQKAIKQILTNDKQEEEINTFIGELPFLLTSSQIAAWNDIKNSLAKTHPMNRFLQGDVGSGKTVVAALAAFLAYLNGMRTLFMCPTEILAQQHYGTLTKLFEHTDVSVELITGSSSKRKSGTRMTNAKLNLKDKCESLSSIIVGTHALISQKHSFDNVGLVIIDEQHRFGVTQRAILKEKSSRKKSLSSETPTKEGSPHLLTMTATPIPRTMALTLFGDLDVSVLSDIPPGRLSVKTYLAPAEKRVSAYHWIEKQISETGCQAFIVCPRITDDDEETESSETKATIKAVETETHNLQTNVFPNLKIAMLHGKMKPRIKEDIMQKFKNGEFHILVTTTVVEVGIDIPNARIIVIEGAERYGLAQLHQLRGRVGRNRDQSYCVLFTTDGAIQSERLSFFAKTKNGMELAEYDFRKRGPGDMYGTAQHGMGELQIASLFDFSLVSDTQKAAGKFTIMYQPEKYPEVAKRLERYTTIQIAKD